MMISRRPKRRASTEKAPGPSKTRAADIAARLKAAIALMLLVAPVIKNDEMPVLRQPTVTTAVATGVRNPTKIADPTAIASAPTAKTLIERLLGPSSASIPQMIALTATVSRRKMRPMPGQRSGKLEKSLCSGCLLGAQNVPARD